MQGSSLFIDDARSKIAIFVVTGFSTSNEINAIGRFKRFVELGQIVLGLLEAADILCGGMVHGVITQQLSYVSFNTLELFDFPSEVDLMQHRLGDLFNQKAKALGRTTQQETP